MSRRVVITGIGVVSPLGCNTLSSWNSVLDGKCGVSKITHESFSNIPSKVAAFVKDEDSFLEIISKNELRTMSRGTMLGLLAAEEALNDAKWKPCDRKSMEVTGVCVGQGIADLDHICQTSELMKQGYTKVTPYFVPRILTNMVAGQISIKYGFQGPNHSVSTACATGAHSIGDAFRLIKHGYSDIMVCGGAEASINPLAIAGFSRLRALSTRFNSSPLIASRPFDKLRDGFVMGEGSSIMVLEELNHAVERNVTMYAEILGYGMSGDASHLTAPHVDGRGAALAMERAIFDAKIAKGDISYVNAHATSTPVGDEIELKAIKTVFKKQAIDLAISSTKGSHGHLLGAAGNLEASFTVLACHSGHIPPTINLENVCKEGKDLNIIARKKTSWTNQRRIALKNSFGFGGTNACLCISSI